MSDEIFDVVDESGRKVGQALRRECHGNPALIHQSVHVMVTNSQGELFLQKRSSIKDIQPGKWDTSVGGHFLPDEQPEAAARREMCEELGVEPVTLTLAYQYLWRSPRETELVRTFVTRHDGPFRLDPKEIDDGRFWSMQDLEAGLGKGLFTPNFEYEFVTKARPARIL